MSVGVVVAAIAWATTTEVALGGSVVVIRVRSVQTSGQIVHDRAPRGLSKGDIVVEKDKLFNIERQFGKPVGALVGRDQATFTLTSGTTGTIVGKAIFSDGTVTIRGSVPLTSKDSISVRVVGGTGVYKGATGTVTEPGSDSPGNATNTYRLTVP